MKREYELIVIGGGPAGVAAASAALVRGVDTLLVDDQADLGGNVYRNILSVTKERPGDLRALGSSYGQGRELIETFSARHRSSYVRAQVWHLDGTPRVGVRIGAACHLLTAKRVIVATGAQERPVPLPGWTLPGVMSVGAAQTLLKASGLTPDVPVVITGNGPLTLLLAQQFIALNVPIAAIVLTTQTSAYLRAATRLPAALRQPRSLVKGLRWAAALRRRGVPVHRRATDLEIVGDGRAEALRFRVGGQTRSVQAGLVLLHDGVTPNVHLTMAAGCRHEWSESQVCWRPLSDDDGRTSHEAIFVAGDTAAILGADAAPLGGELAALAAAADLGKAGSTDAAERRRLRRSLQVHGAFRSFLDVLYAPNRWTRGAGLDDEVVICRCENVTAGDVRAAARIGAAGPNQIKAFTRTGMGPCQGRMCGVTTTELLAAELGAAPADVGHARIRSPVNPITVGQLATLCEQGDAPQGARIYGQISR